jgi:hypothetical protein
MTGSVPSDTTCKPWVTVVVDSADGRDTEGCVGACLSVRACGRGRSLRRVPSRCYSSIGSDEVVVASCHFTKGITHLGCRQRPAVSCARHVARLRCGGCMGAVEAIERACRGCSLSLAVRCPARSARSALPNQRHHSRKSTTVVFLSHSKSLSLSLSTRSKGKLLCIKKVIKMRSIDSKGYVPTTRHFQQTGYNFHSSKTRRIYNYLT